MRCILLIQFIRKFSDLFDAPGYAEPSICLRRSSIVFSVYSKVGIVLTLDQPVVPLVAISSPWLHRERLVLIVLVPRLLVCLLESGLDRIRG